MKRDAGLVAAFVAAVIAFAACKDDGTPCFAGDWRACDCAEGGHGYAQCSADGQAYGTCDCSGKIPGVPGTGGGADAAADGTTDAPAAETSSKLPFMSTCDTNDQCDTGLCYSFNAKGQRCTKPCTQPTDCPPPSTGCNGMGICKAP